MKREFSQSDLRDSVWRIRWNIKLKSICNVLHPALHSSVLSSVPLCISLLCTFLPQKEQNLAQNTEQTRPLYGRKMQWNASTLNAQIQRRVQIIRPPGQHRMIQSQISQKFTGSGCHYHMTSSSLHIGDFVSCFWWRQRMVWAISVYSTVWMKRVPNFVHNCVNLFCVQESSIKINLVKIKWFELAQFQLGLADPIDLKQHGVGANWAVFYHSKSRNMMSCTKLSSYWDM